MSSSTAVSSVQNAVLSGTHNLDFSVFGMFMQADIIVKIVIAMLIFASVWSWTIMLAKKITLTNLNRRAGRFEDAFWSGEALDKLYERVKKSSSDPLLNTFVAGMDEWKTATSTGLPSSQPLQAGLQQRVERAMSLSIGREMNNLERGMTFLASVGSTATFIGLFGTVWGIMNSFTAIAGANNTSLAVVAPGIAEAVFATALGLVAAIPAVVAFNVFSTSINRYADRLDAFSSEFMTILSRHIDSRENRGKKVA
ncbi:MAG: protein TolQ [Alphaproteobacteria bacterium]|nr:protein TolQ [Alphaproteobacteria bacterium]